MVCQHSADRVGSVFCRLRSRTQLARDVGDALASRSCGRRHVPGHDCSSFPLVSAPRTRAGICVVCYCDSTFARNISAYFRLAVGSLEIGV